MKGLIMCTLLTAPAWVRAETVWFLTSNRALVQVVEYINLFIYAYINLGHLLLKKK